ncbi:KamA family radical SAM protein [Myxococcus sp. MISCRS1]|uniref:KamA family radical SAM protein n=1 Tax=Myxococcus TaxID=32 RepID=UPI001CC119CC|nr:MULTISPECIES: KamA family radical SAM protein [unclassified Myxococcus]MBZ4401418.1 KamA family radical SAM protein [Myxococcus sp. AS-1-15]MBZ4414198.1 KamA family radical SAM protein [Myxococcus sp. XM-1-1-1]MCY1002592.1 KamA family radical SAM protein [Myxococcus sp. MISCRS1]BDT35840.1 KamA family radical SAM protein [Myxococcus sp. MH1]
MDSSAWVVPPSPEPRSERTSLSSEGRRRLFPQATDAEWADWRWHQRHAVRGLEQLERYVPLTADERAGVQETASLFRIGISPYYLSLIDPEHPFCPVRMQSIPVRAEARVRPGELEDPLGEDKTRPEECIVHKYPDRVLFLALDTCSVYCRHCTRRRITQGGVAELSKDQMRRGIDYVRRHPEVRDVLISGGDPFLLSEQRLEELLAPLSEIPHVEMIRIGTRVPVVLPMRVTDSLASLLRRYAPVFVVTHFNHPKEVTPEAREACERLVDHGVPVENQAVLMRQLNSDARIIKELSHLLLRTRVRPYYLHQMDVAEGCEHLRTPIAKGLEIIQQLRGHTTGLAVPHLAVDLPGGGGKVTLQPDYVVERNERETVFRNFKGERYAYPEPEETDCACPYDETWRERAQQFGYHRKG